MPKKKKHIRLPNAWGSVRYIGGKRSLPYAVHPPATERDQNGHYIRPKAICYVPDWYTGFGVLSAYHAGTYTPGMEVDISREVETSSMDLDAFCKRVLKNHGMIDNVGSDCPTFGEAYDQFIEWKFGENASREYGKGTKNGYESVYKNHLQSIKDIPLDEITLDQLQKIVNDCERGKGIRTRIVICANAVYKYALPRHLCTENRAAALVVPSGRDSEHGEPFNDDELKKLWAAVDNDPVAATLIIMCYSGFRVSAMYDLEVNLEEKYFRGGVKSAAGKDRIVPIHSAIYPLVQKKMEKYGCCVQWKYYTFRNRMNDAFKRLGMVTDPPHTPHDCRHTFSMLCEKYEVREADRKRLLGHSFGKDVTNAVYGHRTIEELREQIEKIKVPFLDEKAEGNAPILSIK